MSRLNPTTKRIRRKLPAGSRTSSIQARYTVGLAPNVATLVERYAEHADTSMSKAIAALVRLGLENQEQRKQAFLQQITTNLDNQDPAQQDRLVDEFRSLILGQ